MTAVTPQQVIDDWRAGLAPRDPYDDLGVLVREVERLRSIATPEGITALKSVVVNDPLVDYHGELADLLDGLNDIWLERRLAKAAR